MHNWSLSLGCILTRGWLLPLNKNTVHAQPYIQYVIETTNFFIQSSYVLYCVLHSVMFAICFCKWFTVCLQKHLILWHVSAHLILPKVNSGGCYMHSYEQWRNVFMIEGGIMSGQKHKKVYFGQVLTGPYVHVLVQVKKQNGQHWRGEGRHVRNVNMSVWQLKPSLTF